MSTDTEEMKLLERVFNAEFESVANKNGLTHRYTPRNKKERGTADHLVNEGLLVSVTHEDSTAYELTHAGRMLYCMSCDEPGE